MQLKTTGCCWPPSLKMASGNNQVRLATSWNRKRRRRNEESRLLTQSLVPINVPTIDMPRLKSICAILFLLSNLLFMVISAESDSNTSHPVQVIVLPQAQQAAATLTISPSQAQTTQNSSSSWPTNSLSAALVSSVSLLSPQAQQQASSTTTTQPSQTTSARSQQQQQLERDATARANRHSGNVLIASHLRMEPVCQVNDGESVAILEIEESRGSDMSQRTSPSELPISGSVSSGEIELKIESETHKYFQVEGKSLRLIRPLDRDAKLRENSTQIVQQPITSIYLQVSCVDKRTTGDGGGGGGGGGGGVRALIKKVIIPVLVKVLDLNDNAPKFSQASYSIEVNELAPAGTIIMDQFAFAIDLDSASNGQVEYSLLGGGGSGVQAHPVLVAAPKPLVSVTNQRLIQRAPLESSSTTPTPTTKTTTTTTTTTTITTTGGMAESKTAGPWETLSGRPGVEQTSTGAPPIGMETTEEKRAQSRPNGLTINLDSEPIMNGPMEEPDEDESDEALLAAMNSGSDGNTNGNSSETDAELSAFASSLGEPAPSDKRRRARRHTPETHPMTTTSDSMRKQLPLTTTAARAVAVPPRSAPWTNLMMISNEELLTLDDGKGAHLTATLRSRESTTSGPESSPNRVANDNDYFALELSPQTNRPVLRLKRQLDYETQRVHQLTLVATDRAANKLERLSSYARVLIRVLDGDDQPPAFMLDQVGCATNALPRTTTPLPSSVPAGVLANSSNQPLVLAESLAPTATTTTTTTTTNNNINNNLRLRSFAVTDENFDFGDTLGLDDTPLDEDAGAAGGVTNSVAGRTRRVPNRPSGTELSSQRPALPVVASANDYSCLPSTSGQESPGSGRNSHQAEYFATVTSGDSDYLLRIAPQAIRARDRDELNAPIRYSLLDEGSSPANFSHYFQINPLDATIKQVAPVERSHVSEFMLLVMAQEQSYNRLFSVAKLTIDVLPTDKNPPVLAPNSYSGYVNENSPLGTRVFVARPPSGSENSTTPYLRIAVLDSDSAATGHQHQQPQASHSKPRVQFDFETTSDAFKVDSEGYLYVNRFPLDRDSTTLGEAGGASSASASASGPVHMFQVTARQVGLVSSRSVSSPVSLNITLGDLNDNAPQLLNSSLGPVVLAATSQASGAQQLVRLQALDRDLAENAQMHFSIQHVSQGGASRFRIHEDSGRIEALGRFVAGEQFSLSVQVADDLGRASQGIVDVRVVPGANTGPPQFLAPETMSSGEPNSQLVEARDSMSASARLPATNNNNNNNYLLHQLIEVNEAVPVGSQITQVRAQDPENEPVSYSLIGGNTNGDFSMNSRTGSLVVANKLDREEISAYRLVVQARDSGGLATSRPLHIQVTDANDQNPTFSQSHYVFAIEEGVPAVGHGEDATPMVTVGRVLAQDSDEGENGRVSYSLMMLAEGGSGPYTTAGRGASSEGGVVDTPTTETHPNLFAIDERTGEIKLNRALDYERARGHTLLVVARDHGESPRSSSAMVQVKVLDRQDELPHFERAHLEVRVDENAPAGQQVAHVQARDPDSVAQVTYVLLAGDPDNLFQVDPQTGQVTTTLSANLDYEQVRMHSLTIGTNESLAALGQETLAGFVRQLDEYLRQTPRTDRPLGQLAQKWLVMRVDVHVNDVNDNAPQFESGASPLLPVRVQDWLAPGSVLDVHLQARDADGSAPNNQVKYELVTAKGVEDQHEMFTHDKCARLFLVDSTTCKVSVRQDLRTSDSPGGQAVSECQLVIRARDTPLAAVTPTSGGRDHQSLSSLVTLTIYIDHLAEISPSSIAAFADTSYTLELAENAPANTLVKVLPVINKPKAQGSTGAASMAPMSCEIVTGNELNRFYVRENEQCDCELRTRDHLLDYEQRQRFLLAVRLNTFGSVAGQRQSTLTRVQINVLDRNDNRPMFAQPPSRYAHLTQNRYLAAVARDAPPETQLAQLRASDSDSPQANGLISYELFSGAGEGAQQTGSEMLTSATTGGSEQQLESRFRVDPMDGIVRTSKPIEDIAATRLPLRLRVVARDNPELTSEALEATVELVVNLIEDHHRLVLVLRDTPPSRVLDAKDQLLGVLQERTGLISGLERVESMRVQRNASLIETELGGTDVWFYLVEPGTMRLVASDDPRLKSALFEGRAQNSIADILTQSLGLTGGSRARVRLPYALTDALAASATTSGHASLFFGAFRAESRDRLAPALILIALFIALASAIVVIYQCGSVAGWSESSERQQQAAVAGQLVLPPGLLQYPLGSYPGMIPKQHQHQQQQQHFSKEQFLFSQPPPPAAASIGQYEHSGSQLDDSMRQPSAHKRRLGDRAQGPRSSLTSAQTDPYHWGRQGPRGPEVTGATMLSESQAKEYETQMLKMSVFFDDSQSFVDRESAAHADYGDNKNLV